MQDQAEGVGASIVSRLAGAWMVDSEWSSPIDGGFRWWAHRLEQRITVQGDDEDGRVLRRAAELGADVAVSEHPASGLRPAPDEMLDWNNAQRSRLEPATVQGALAEVLPFFGVPKGTELAATYYAPEALQAAADEAFKQAAANAGQPGQLWDVAHALEANHSQPWKRISGWRPPSGRSCPGGDPLVERGRGRRELRQSPEVLPPGIGWRDSFP